MIGWTYIKIDNNLRRYKTPCTTLQHKKCECIGECIEPYLIDSKSKKYFRLCRKINFRVLEIFSAYGVNRFMTINPTIKFLGIAIRKGGKDENSRPRYS